MDVWPYSPAGAITEALEWLTDVQRCRSAEYRRSLRTKPRQELSVNYKMTPALFGKAKLEALALGASTFFVPLWPWFWQAPAIASGTDLVWKDVTDPDVLTDPGTSIMIWESPSKYEVHVVDELVYPNIVLTETVDQSFTAPLIVPLRVGEFAQEFEATRSAFDTVEASARFRIMAGDDYSSTYGRLYYGETYSSRTVITDRPLCTTGIREQFERRFEEVDSVIGGAYRYPILTTAESAGQLAWSAQTRAGMRALLYWIHSRKGRWKSFWAPTWNSDLTVTSEIASNATSIQIADIGMRTKCAFPVDIMILTTAGARIYCHVTGSTAGSAGNEVLSLSAQVGAHLYTWDIAATCMLTASRFDSDRVEINHERSGRTTASVRITEVPA